MDTIHPPLKPFIKELNNTLLKILNELQTIKIQQQEFINIKILLIINAFFRL